MTDQNDSHASSHSKHNAVIEANQWMDPDVLGVLTNRILNENASVKNKRAKIIKIANEINMALAPHVACRAGCSQCCHMSTQIYQHEAEHLAAVSGRKMTRLTYRDPAVVQEVGEKSYGQPCPFLIDNKCSVYEDRPLVCRVHHSLNDDAAQCDTSLLPEQKKGVAMYDPNILEVPYAKLNVVKNVFEPWGNIREFFPK